MIESRELRSETRIDEVSDGHPQFLLDQPEERDLEDRDCAITPMPIQMFEAEDRAEGQVSPSGWSLADRATTKFFGRMIRAPLDQISA